MRLILFVLTIFLLEPHYEASKILGIFPLPSKSHSILGSALLKGLARRGHQVTMLSPFRMNNLPPNYTEVHWNYMNENEDVMKVFANPKLSGFQKLKIALEGMSNFIDKIHNNGNLKAFLNSSEKFDLCIYLIGLTDSFLGICHQVNATIIGFNTVGMNVFIPQMTKCPTPYSYVPNLYMPFSDDMSFFQRVANTVAWTSTDLIMNFFNTPLQEYLLSKYYPSAPPLDDLLDSVDLILANSNYATDTLVAYPPNVIQIGGFHIEEDQEHSKEIQTYLDNAKRGVIYFNLGTNAKSKYIHPEILLELINTFSKLPYDVLWKYEDEMPNKPENAKLERWLPQKQILNHPNIKLFITHAGNGGTIEAIYGGVPMICMPHYGDQLKNCAGSVAAGYAIKVDIGTLTEETLSKAIHNILNNSTFKEAIMLKSDIYKNQAVKPMDRAAFWVEHAIKHKGAKHLKTSASQLSWYKRNLLDVIGFLLGIVIICLCILYYCIKLVYKLVCKKNRKYLSKVKQQ